MFFGLSGTGKTTPTAEPDIYATTRRFGAILENVAMDSASAART